MFSFHQLVPLYIASLTLAILVVAFHGFRIQRAGIWIFLCAGAFAFFAANLDPFPGVWDEQYHALVAKNLTQNPLKPVLYAQPLLDYNPSQWTNNFIWLHKQPLFLWQIALSIKIFGSTVFAVRLPSIIMHALTAVLIFGIGKRLLSGRIGFMAAVLFATNYYALELVAGRFSTDHNDVAFIFYMTATFWSWQKYVETKHWRWLMLTGLFSGAAILVKWLVGLLIYAVWAAWILTKQRSDAFSFKSWKPALQSLFITALTAIPWQLYILLYFPKEAALEFRLNGEHFTRVVEHHGGDFWFHFRAVNDLYGSGFLVPILLISGFVIMLRLMRQEFRIPVFIAVLLPYLFYSMAQTKMTSFTAICIPFGSIALATVFHSVIDRPQLLIRSPRLQVISLSVLVGLGCWMNLNLDSFRKLHADSPYSVTYNRAAHYQQLAASHCVNRELAGRKWVIFNADIRLNGHIELMFFTGKTAYPGFPDSRELAKLQSGGYHVAVLNNRKLPGYILRDQTIRKVSIPTRQH